MDAIDKLVAVYPEFFDERAVAMSSLPPGWLDLVDRLCADLRAQLPPGETVRISQVKSKFGGLRLYAACSYELRPLIHAAEETSQSLCEKCGSPGRHVNVEFIEYTLCAKHEEAIKKHRGKRYWHEDGK